MNIRNHLFTTIFAASTLIGGATLAGQTLAESYGDNPNQMDKTKTSTYAEDTEITAKVKAKFVEDRQVRAIAISVETRDGVVDLTGNARSEAEKMRAEKLAMETKGVRKVTNHIVVL